MTDGVRAFENPTTSTRTKRYEIVGYDEIPVDHVSRNTHNPRPDFHFREDDPQLIKLGDSIRIEGQHRPALVYEQMGHYELPDAPGRFVLLQGERRWRSCKLSGVATLRSLIVPTPVDQAEELEWLGIEEAFKQDWQYFFVLQFANRLATELGVPITSTDIATKTGLEPEDLRTAEKIFKLEPTIQELVADYEELEYQNRQARASGRRAPAGSKVREFSAKKAAIVWDICEVLTQNFPQIIGNLGLDALELQTRVTSKATRQRATHEELDNLLSMLRTSAQDPAPGMLTEIAELLDNPDRKVKDSLRSSGNQQASKYSKVILRLAGVEPVVRQMNGHLGQIGSDVDALQRDLTTVLRLRAALMDLERGIEAQIQKNS